MKKLVLIPLLFMVSCGKNSSSHTPPHNEVPVVEEMMDGIYGVKFLPLNTNVAGTTFASAKLVLRNNTLKMDIHMKGAPALVRHGQYIHTGTRCPTEKDDRNNDGFVDMTEAARYTSDRLIPLDNNIEKQIDDRSRFPLAAIEDGGYFWQGEGQLDEIIQDLLTVDPDPEDHLAKLTARDGLKLLGKVIQIYGVNDLVDLPESVDTINGQRPHMNLPIACGVIANIP